MRSVSEKQLAKRKANGERFIASSIAPKSGPSKQTSGGYCPIRRKTKGKPKNAKRSKANLARAHGPVERREWTKLQPCLVPDCGRSPCDAAHLISGGTGRKSEAAWTVPFCSSNVATGYRGHHDEYDGGKRSFMAKYFPGIERAELAVAVEKLWQAHSQRGE